MIVLVKERAVAVAARSTFDVKIGKFPFSYWKYLLATAVFGIGNSSNSLLILRTKDIGVSLPATIMIYAAFNLVAALISFPAGRRYCYALTVTDFASRYLLTCEALSTTQECFAFTSSTARSGSLACPARSAPITACRSRPRRRSIG
jgi:hypothetical protein